MWILKIAIAKYEKNGRFGYGYGDSGGDARNCGRGLKSNRFFKCISNLLANQNRAFCWWKLQSSLHCVSHAKHTLKHPHLNWPIECTFPFYLLSLCLNSIKKDINFWSNIQFWGKKTIQFWTKKTIQRKRKCIVFGIYSAPCMGDLLLSNPN